MPYTPRRQSAKWLDADCPKGVLAIYDDPRTLDRYTIMYVPCERAEYRDTYIEFLGASEDPFHGLGQHGELSARDAAMYRYAVRNRACKWSSLPEAVKRCVRNDLTTESSK